MESPEASPLWPCPQPRQAWLVGLQLHTFADGDHVIVEARCHDDLGGETLRQRVLPLIYRFEGGRIVKMREYCDSVLCEARLGLFQASKSAIS